MVKRDKAIPPFKKLRIEPNSDCNRGCVFCPRDLDPTRWEIKNERKKRVNLFMETDLVESILRQNIEQGFMAEVGFDFYNEPTSDDRLLHFAEYAKKVGTKNLNLVTNGDKIKKDPAYAEEIFKLFNHVQISLYDYKTNEKANELKKWWHNYLGQLSTCSKQKYKVSAANIETINGVSTFSGFTDRAGAIPRERKKKKFNRGMAYNDKLPLHSGCRKIHKKFNIRFDGEVAMCCEDSHVKGSLGNVKNNTLEEIWWGERMKQATALLQKGHRKDLIPCNKCTVGRCSPSQMRGK